MMDDQDEGVRELPAGRIDAMVSVAVRKGSQRALVEAALQATTWACAVALLVASVSVSIAWVEQKRLAATAVSSFLMGGEPS